MVGMGPLINVTVPPKMISVGVVLTALAPWTAAVLLTVMLRVMSWPVVTVDGRGPKELERAAAFSSTTDETPVTAETEVKVFWSMPLTLPLKFTVPLPLAV